MWLEWNIWLGLMLVIILFINALVSNYDMVFQRQVSICNGCHYLSYWCCGAEMWYPHIIINFVNYVPPPFHRSYPSVEICYYIAAPCGVAFDNRNLESIQWGQNRSTLALKHVTISQRHVVLLLITWNLESIQWGQKKSSTFKQWVQVTVSTFKQWVQAAVRTFKQWVQAAVSIFKHLHSVL